MLITATCAGGQEGFLTASSEPPLPCSAVQDARTQFHSEITWLQHVHWSTGWHRGVPRRVSSLGWPESHDLLSAQPITSSATAGAPKYSYLNLVPHDTHCAIRPGDSNWIYNTVLHVLHLFTVECKVKGW